MGYDAGQDLVPVIADACRVARHVQRNLEQVKSLTKDDRSPVTVADFAVQAAVSLALPPDMPIVGEERADMLRNPEQRAILSAVVDAVRLVQPDATPDRVLAAIDRCDHDASATIYYALDPVDGTKGFLRGQQYAIALGVVHDGAVIAGVLGCPNLPVARDRPLDAPDDAGAIYGATLGLGAWQYTDSDATTRTAIHAARRDDRDDRPIRVCESVEKAHSKQSDTGRILDVLRVTSEPVRLDSQCKYAVVARGQADAYLRLPTSKAYIEKIWDHAAGSIIAAEAGAVVTDVTGAPLDFRHGRRLETNRGIVCAAAELHPRLIDAIDQLGIAVTA